jgi:hypothetical protein
MNKIYYNNFDIFSGICYTPFVSYVLESDGHIQAKETITLDGEIFSDCISGSSGIFLKQKNLINNFSKNFSNFKILENSQTIYSCDYAVIKSIDFDESNYAYVVPFSIEIDCYEKDFFSGYYGVYGMENTFELEESQDQIVAIAHNVSAKGFNNHNSAIYNATNWVNTHSGLKNMPQTAFIKMNNGNEPILTELTEEINRFDGSASIKEVYQFDQAILGSGILRYVTDIKLNRTEFNIVSLKGQINMGRYGNISQARNRFKNTDFYSIASHIYRKSTLLNDLSAIPLKHSIKEKLTENTLDFDIEFNNDNGPIVVLETSASIDKGNSVSKSQFTASIKTKLSSRSGIVSARYQEVLNYFKNNFNPIQEFIKNMPNVILDYDLANFRHEQDSVKFLEKRGIIEYSCTWSINSINKFLPCYFKSISIELESGPQINDYSFVQPICSDWVAFIKGYKWKYGKASGKITVYPGNESLALQWARNLLAGHGGIKNVEIETTSPGNINFEYKYDIHTI